MFSNDLIKGKEIEVKVMNLLNDEGFNLIQNPNEKEIDLIYNLGIEIKFDISSAKTGNFYIEFECNGKPSGLFRQEKTKLEYWAQTDGTTLFLLYGDKFKMFVENIIKECREKNNKNCEGYKVIEKGGDGGRSKGLLIPVKKFREISDLIYNL